MLSVGLIGAALAVIVLGVAPALLKPASAVVTIGAKGFTEQQLLGELLAQEIEGHEERSLCDFLLFHFRIFSEQGLL